MVIASASTYVLKALATADQLPNSLLFGLCLGSMVSHHYLLPSMSFKIQNHMIV